MDIDEARKILGKPAEGMTDDQIRDVIANTGFLVESWLDQYERKIFDGQTLAEKLPQTATINFSDPLSSKR